LILYLAIEKSSFQLRDKILDKKTILQNETVKSS
jgi:hypothetical protein